MSGSNRWSKIKRKKKKKDKARSKKFSKLVEKIQSAAKECDGNRDNPRLSQLIEQAKEADMPKDNIEDAIERALSEKEGEKEIAYEAYGPGGVAMIIETHSSNRNKSAAEIRHILDTHECTLGKPGDTKWAFDQKRDTQDNRVFIPQNTIPVSEEDKTNLKDLITDLKENEEVEAVFTNAE
ncbi:MAG: hypothetical protein BRC24_01815 [Parcubacteria group bacterium SW_4_46_8]|nr:MAG: hypothetical protein BRC24_01815 [Parcubacteria group bacterium SW_4_46_8]